MDAEKFELLDAKIRETALLVSRLRQEKRQVEEENAQLRQRIVELETTLQEVEANTSHYAPDIDSLLAQLDTLHTDADVPVVDADVPVVDADPVSTAIDDIEAKVSKSPNDYYELGRLHEQKSHYDQAITAYQEGLRLDPRHLDTMQRLAFLLEKLNRDAEAAPWWDKIWAMQSAQANPRRRRSR